jgi:pyruvate dehydrogenase E2 component (dihydrolipoamide acetyltransferase)
VTCWPWCWKAAPLPAAPAAPAAAAPAAAAPPAPRAAARLLPPCSRLPLPVATVPAHQPGTAAGGLPHASPSVRKFARELGVPLDEVKGTGPRAASPRTTCRLHPRRDERQRADQAMPRRQCQGAGGCGQGRCRLGLIPWPKVDFAKFGPVERKEMSRIKKISGANLLRNAVMIPAVTNHDDADITDLEAFRVSTNKENEKSGIKVTMLAFLIKACVAALKKFPEFNSSLDGDSLVYKQYFHIGFAADTPNGLVVPVIKDADKKGICQISQEMGELAKKARDGKLARPT